MKLCSSIPTIQASGLAWMLIGLVQMAALGTPLDLKANPQAANDVKAEVKDASKLQIRKAWEAWEENDQTAVEAAFKKAIEADETNRRAYLGLMLLYSLQDKTSESWDVFKNLLDTVENSYPYVYATWLRPRFALNGRESDGEVIDLLQQLSAKADSDGVLKAMANQKLGEHFLTKDESSNAQKRFREMSAITDWMVIGPFENIASSGFDRVYPPEDGFDASGSYLGQNGIPAEWFQLKTVPHNRWIDITKCFAQNYGIFYGNNFIHSPIKQRVQIRIGKSGSLKAFLNDALLVSDPDENNDDSDTYIIETELEKGWNRFLIKCGYFEIARCNFLVRITDERGDPIPGLKISSKQQKYTSRTKVPVRLVENFAERFFQRMIEEHPDHLENYVLLADCYLRNDKAVQAELILRRAVEQSPRCALFYVGLLEAYLRGEKRDEFTATIEKIEALDPKVPFVIRLKVINYLQNGQLAEAEEAVKKLEELRPGSESVFALYANLYTAKNQYDKLIENARLAHQRFPRQLQFVNQEARLSYQTTRKFDRAIAILKDYLELEYTLEGLQLLAQYYLENSDLDNWESTYRNIIKLEPAAPRHNLSMANVYFGLQRLDKVEVVLKSALELCPNASVCWASLGEVNRARKMDVPAKHAFRQALLYQPTDYDSRAALRELEDKPAVFTLFESEDIRTLINEAPEAEDYPEDAAIILLDDTQRVVYKEGASESLQQNLLRVLNNSGIDQLKERLIPYDVYSEVLSIDKAVVIKADGTEVPADINDNHIVFKTLEKGDFLHLKWRIKNYYSGELTRHFWDVKYFNGFYPAQKIRYALLVPPALKFKVNTQNMPNEPQVREVEEGVIHTWLLQDEPAVNYEVSMPSLADEGKVLYLSTFEDWAFVVDWYANLSRAKTRSSYEIKEQVRQILEPLDAPTADDLFRAVYDFINDEIRYSHVSFRQSGFIPQSARDVLVNKIGDCKDMVTLSIAMLREAGLEAHYVLVNTRNEGLNKHILPSLSFNHCMVAVETELGLRFADLTANGFSLESVPPLDVDAFALLIKPETQSPFYLSDNHFHIGRMTRRTRVAVQPNNSIEARCSSTAQGWMSGSIRRVFRDKGEEERRVTLGQFLAQDISGAKLKSFAFEGLDQLGPTVTSTIEYVAEDYISEAGDFKLLKLPWIDTFKSSRALSYEERTYPIDFMHGSKFNTEEIHVELPEGFKPLKLTDKVNFTCSVAEYSLKLDFKDGVIKGVREVRYIKDRIEPEEYTSFRDFYTKVIKEDTRQIVLTSE